MQKMYKTAICCLLLLTTTACTPVVAQRGNMLQDYQLDQIKPGTSTKSDVLRNLGSPTAESTFNPNVWYYMGQETEKRGIMDAHVVKERVIVLSFNNEGIVQSIEDAEGDRMDIPYTRAKTPTHGNDLTFMQQLLGNMGRFNAPTGEKE